MMRADLSGRCALVTGGASGIGLATVRMLADMGAWVAINHLPGDEAAIAQIDQLRAAKLDVIAAPGDVSTPGEAETMVTAAAEALGGLDYLVNNAATAATKMPIPMSDLDAMTEEFWQTILNTNLIGAHRCVKAAAPFLKKRRGAVVNLASTSAHNAKGSSLAYATAKAGTVNMTRAMARGLGPEIRVNAVSPGHVETGWNAHWPDDWRTRDRESAALGRNCVPEEIAEVILFLLAGASAVTGQTLIVDAGLTA